MRPLVLHGGLAQTLFVASCVGWAAGEALWFFPRVIDRLRGRAVGRRRDRGTSYVISITVVLGLSLAFHFARDADSARLPGPGWAPVALGLLVFWAGVGLRAWAIVKLGRFFQPVVTVQEDQPVVQDGPYRFVRHPSYTGALTAFAGVGISLDTWVAIPLALVLPAMGLMARIGVEESALREELGERYERYAQRTRRLIPGVW